MTFDTGPAGSGAARPAPPAAGPGPGPAAGGNVAVATPVLVQTAPVDVTAGEFEASTEPTASAVTEGACAGLARPSANPAPMRLFHLSIAYLTLLFAVIAVTALLPWGGW
jgi:hypothetical protein